MHYAEVLGIELLFLPSYSPNLNLIERLWKYVKKACLYSKYYDKFKNFKDAIIDCLENRTTGVMQELETLLTCEFQSFENNKIFTFGQGYPRCKHRGIDARPFTPALREAAKLTNGYAPKGRGIKPFIFLHHSRFRSTKCGV